MLPIVTNSLLDLEMLVRGDFEISNDVPELIDDESVLKNNGETYRKKSPFGRHFEDVYKKCLDIIKLDKELIKIKNPSYYPNILEYLLTNYLPILPFWTGIVLSRIRKIYIGR